MSAIMVSRFPAGVLYHQEKISIRSPDLFDLDFSVSNGAFGVGPDGDVDFNLSVTNSYGCII